MIFEGTLIYSLYTPYSIYFRMAVYLYIYMVTPAATRTPLKNTENINTNADFYESNFGAVSTD